MIQQIKKLKRQWCIFKLELWCELARLINKIVHHLNNLSQAIIDMGNSMIAEIEKEDAADESA